MKEDTYPLPVLSNEWGPALTERSRWILFMCCHECLGSASSFLHFRLAKGKILAHAGETAPVRELVRLPGPCAPPEGWC